MKTFATWSKAGYKIKKGEHGVKVGKEYYFSDAQVVYSPRYSYNATFKGCAPKGTSPEWGGDYDEEEDDMSNPLFYDYRGFRY